MGLFTSDAPRSSKDTHDNCDARRTIAALTRKLAVDCGSAATATAAVVAAVSPGCGGATARPRASTSATASTACFVDYG